MTVSPAALTWLQMTPAVPPVVGPAKSVRVDLSAKAGGTLVIMPPILSSGTATLPSDRICFRDAQGDYVPISPGGSQLAILPAKNPNYVLNLNLAAVIQPSDPPGTYQGTARVLFNGPRPAEATISITLEIAPWAQVSYQPDPAQIASPTGNPGDDLTGQSQVTVQCNGQWTLEIAAPGDFVSASSSFPSNQAYFARNAGGPWTVLGPVWNPLASGTGSTQFTLYLKVVQPFDKRAGVYTSPLSLRIGTL